MDLGLKGKNAIVCASSRGLGFGCAQALAREGVNITINGVNPENLARAAAELQQFGVKITPILGDVAQEAVRHALIQATGQVDILVNNAGGPPPGDDFTLWGEEQWLSAIRANMLAPIEMMKMVLPTMKNNGFGRVVNITSGAVKAPISNLGLSNGARSGLTGFVAGLARRAEYASNGVTINNLLPGKFKTDRILKTLETPAKSQGISLDEMVKIQEKLIPAGRFGTREEFGAFCAFICSTQAGYFTGQNILLDGGHYPGSF